MDRRAFLAGAAALCAAPLAAEAQQVKTNRIGVLTTGAGAADSLRQNLRKLGYVEGQNVAFELRYTEGRPERLDEFAFELARLKVDVIVASYPAAVFSARRASATIPIVMVNTPDPVDLGLVASLARPGGNITGLTARGQELSGKRLEVLKETVPKVSRVAVLSNPTNPDSVLSLKGIEVAARALGVQFRVKEVHDPTKLDKAFEDTTREGARALMVLPDPMFVSEGRRIVALAAQSRLPAMYAHREFVDAGGLMFYGASLADMWRRAAIYVDKILKGTKPADLPVEQPTKFDFIINLKAAKQIGLTIPPNVLARATKVIK
jgi:putative tryptophan/tyrosine transport system substrate-binding protein